MDSRTFSDENFSTKARLRPKPDRSPSHFPVLNSLTALFGTVC